MELNQEQQQLRLCFVWAVRYGDLIKSERLRSELTPSGSTTRVVALVGVGAWYHSIHSGFGTDLGNFARWWETNIRPKTTSVSLIMRDPLPQHFQTLSGVYIESKERGPTPTTRCSVAPKETDFRLTAFSASRARGAAVGEVLPLHTLLRPLPMAHPSPGDCTHYCFAAAYLMNCELARLLANRTW